MTNRARRDQTRAIKNSNVNIAAKIAERDPDERTRREIAAARRSVLIREERK